MRLTNTLIFLLVVVPLVLYSGNNLPEQVTDVFRNEGISPEALADFISGFDDFPDLQDRGKSYLEYNTISDTLQAPYIFQVPLEYDPGTPTPLLVYLHGGVGRADFIEDPTEVMQDNPFLGLVNELNWFILFPMANVHTMWWDKSGLDNIDYQIRRIKSDYNIDDNRVYVTGFSDGGSGSFHLALCHSDQFAAFYPLNGMLTVGASVSAAPVYLPNLRNHHVYAVNTDEDLLYPAAEMYKLMDLALDAGADLVYREYWGIGHDFDYAGDALPLLRKDMSRQIRDPYPPRIFWESSGDRFNRIDWLEILAVDSTRVRSNWQKEYNVTLLDKRLQFGIYLDQEAENVIITGVLENSSAFEMGLQENDRIIAMDGTPVSSREELLELRDRKQRGDGFSITVIRADSELTLPGRFPEATSYEAFDYSVPSGSVEAYYCGNVFEIYTSRVSKIAIYLSPEMINPEIPVKVLVDDKILFDDLIEYDREIIRKEFERDYDRKRIFIHKLLLEF